MDDLRETHIYASATRDRRAKLGIDEQSYVEWLRRLIPWLTERYGSGGQKLSVLDFGCGTGELTVLMNCLGCRTVGFDVHREHLRLARILARENELDPSLFVDGSGQELPFASGAFDVVHLHVVLEHLSDEVLADVLPELRRVCSGGLYVTVPNRLQLVDDHTGLAFVPWLPSSLAALYVRLRGSDYGYGISATGEWDVTYRSFARVRSVFRRHGFRMVIPPDEVIYPPSDAPSQAPLVRRHELSRNRWKRIVWKLIGRVAEWTMPDDAPPEAHYPYLNLILEPRVDGASQ